MKKILVIFFAVVAVLLVGALVWFFQFDSVGQGRGVVSPDKKFHATASSFWGGTHNHYEFTIESAEGKRVQRVVMDQSPQRMIGWRDDGLIQWAADSSSVTYTFNGTQLILSVKP